MNKTAKKGQMDLIVRFCQDDKIRTEYLTSMFLEHSTAEDLLMVFNSGLESLKLDIKYAANCTGSKLSQCSATLFFLKECLILFVNSIFKNLQELFAYRCKELLLIGKIDVFFLFLKLSSSTPN